ncbi:hypothetical protein [Streptomyces sp. HUAS ZL42]|uniref:hypothetical protein n=1 Tax=Streptomyces sp. HUAS ZL42 TaxID=3231715 RepID=UPI00345EE8FC
MLLEDGFSARDAEKWGLVHRGVPDGSAAAEVLEFARSLAAGPNRRPPGDQGPAAVRRRSSSLRGH